MGSNKQDTHTHTQINRYTKIKIVTDVEEEILHELVGRIMENESGAACRTA